jgi:hypothetical protein
MNNISVRKVVFFGFAILSSCAVLFSGAGDVLRQAEKPSEYIGLVCSILAASTLVVIAISGEAGNLLRGGWRSAWEQANAVQLRLLRMTWLFVFYMIVLALLILSEMIESQNWAALFWVHDIFAGSAFFAFIISLGLPFELKQIQSKRLEREIRDRKADGP